MVNFSSTLCLLAWFVWLKELHCSFAKALVYKWLHLKLSIKYVIRWMYSCDSTNIVRNSDLMLHEDDEGWAKIPIKNEISIVDFFVGCKPVYYVAWLLEFITHTIARLTVCDILAFRIRRKELFVYLSPKQNHNDHNEINKCKVNFR